jgi:hypothetical protein
MQVFGSLPACRYGHDLPFVEAIKQRSDTGAKFSSSLSCKYHTKLNLIQTSGLLCQQWAGSLVLRYGHFAHCVGVQTLIICSWILCIVVNRSQSFTPSVRDLRASVSCWQWFWLPVTENRKLPSSRSKKAIATCLRW